MRLTLYCNVSGIGDELTTFGGFTNISDIGK